MELIFFVLFSKVVVVRREMVLLFWALESFWIFLRTYSFRILTTWYVLVASLIKTLSCGPTPTVITNVSCDKYDSWLHVERAVEILIAVFSTLLALTFKIIIKKYLSTSYCSSLDLPAVSLAMQENRHCLVLHPLSYFTLSMNSQTFQVFESFQRCSTFFFFFLLLYLLLSVCEYCRVFHHTSLQPSAKVLITGTRHTERRCVHIDWGCVRAGTQTGFLGIRS